MKNLLAFAFAFVVSAVAGLTQGLELSDHTRDTSEIINSWDSWSIRVFGAQKAYRFSVRNRENDAITKYVPNNRYSIGIGMTYKWIALDLGFNIKPSDQEETRRLDLSLALRFDRNIMDLRYQRYRGFDLQDQDGSGFPFRSDIRAQLTGFSFYRTQPRRMLSLSALNSGMQGYKKSTGVFGYGAYWYWDQIKADSAIIPSAIRDDFNDRAAIEFSSQFSLGILGGYAYSLVLPSNFFAFAALLPGVGFNAARLEADRKYRAPLFPAFRFDGHGAIGYSGAKIYVVLSFATGINAVPWGGMTSYRFRHQSFKLSVGYRLFSQIGFLEKVADVLKPSELLPR